MIVRASHVLAADGSTLDNGVVHVDGGRIVGVGRAGRADRRKTTDLGDSLLLPGFVNAHTHLELSHLAGKVPPQGNDEPRTSVLADVQQCAARASVRFVGWLARLSEETRADADDPARVRRAVQRGRDLSLAAGVTTVGDITRQPALTRPLLAAGPLRVVSFGEVIAFGRLRDRLNARLAAAADRTHDSPWLQAGISPHAPYTLEPEGLRACTDRARRDGRRLCTHLAETDAESLFCTQQTGPLGELLERLGVWDDDVPCHGLSPVELAAQAGLLGPTCVLAHVNYASDGDLNRLAAAGAHVAYCPRTHQAFGHPPHRFADMLARGINVCVGTDSLASNPSLSVLDELRFLRRQRPALSANLLLALGTRHGALALGLADALGTIAPGMQADLTAVPLDSQGARDPSENVLQSETEPTAVCVAGRRAKPPR